MRNKLLFCFMLCIICCHLFFDNGWLDLTDPLNQSILLEVRIPRVIMGVVAGIVLSLSGLTFQIILRNNLADSFSLGIASGASLGSAFGVIAGLSLVTIAISGIVMSLITLIIVILLSIMIKASHQSVWVVLTGMFINLFCSSVLYMLILFVPDKTRDIMNYLFGTLGNVSLSEVLIVLPISIIGILLLYYYHRPLELLSLGQEHAHVLGLEATRSMYLLLMIASITTAILISFTGVIGFVGMVIPPSVRFFARGNFVSKMHTTALLGIVLILLGDFLGKVIMPPVQIPVSIMMCLIGFPLLIITTIKQMRISRN
ncbi:FecCD family ABC transporter permease [Macrococcoides canis]|uniref:FecCD family ABC transporter permease n=2 Tax=Macrococcoides canis TaxID=1855823 RepID=UPI0020B79B5E|nr:iron ABC transporter permease [Macrococcus canis]UTH06686.1 iron ABC transporter permease [Macrococcus canis]UTH09037.1 iron ABC transporter permease [Macrococcus canis]